MRSWNLVYEYLSFVMIMNDPFGLIFSNMRKI